MDAYLYDYYLQWLNIQLSKFRYNMEWALLRNNEKVSIRIIETSAHKKNESHMMLNHNFVGYIFGIFAYYLHMNNNC